MNNNDNLQKAWEETGKAEFLEQIKSYEEENLNELIGSKFADAWKGVYDVKQEKEKVLICADERVMPLEGEFKIGTAGQLILDSEDSGRNSIYTVPTEEETEFIKKFKGKIKAVRSHSGCGAAGIAYSKLNEEEKQKFIVLVNELSLQGIPLEEVSQADLYGAYHSYDLSKKLGAKFEHTPFSAMRGYKEFHDARIIFWSADPLFDPSGLVDTLLPPHFLSNGLAFGLNEDYCKEELKTLSGIALGDHGFGALFDSNNPFYAISVGKDEKEAERLNSLAKEALKEFGNRIKFKYIVSGNK